MKSERNFIYLIHNLREKHRLSVRDQHNDTEVWYMHISPLNMLAGFFALVLVLFIIITTVVAYTPILDLIPGYPGNRSRELLIENIMRLDSMERELQDMQIYNENVALIMSGKTPVVPTSAEENDSLKHAKMNMVVSSPEDSLLRAEMEQGGIYKLADPITARKKIRSSMELMAPVKGAVATRFNPKQSRYGVGVATATNQQVMAVDGGTVVLSAWSPSDGYIIQIQHPNNMISVYKHATSVLKSQGERVRSGEVIGYTGEGVSGEEGKGLFEIELWHNGTPVDPEGYIVF